MKKGFTLIELLISITIFSIVMVAFLGLFISAFKYQKRSLNTIYLLNSTSYITEYMSRALRMAKKDLSSACISSKYNFENPEDDSSKIRFLNYNNECQGFYLINEAIVVEKDEVVQNLSPANISVKNLKFEIKGEKQDDNFQPKVTFTIGLIIGEQMINLQSTISQRDLDVKY